MGSDPQGTCRGPCPDDGKERSVIAGERNRTDIYTMADGRRDLSRKGEREEKMHGEWGNARAATGDGFGNWLHVLPREQEKVTMFSQPTYDNKMKLSIAR